ncbi:MAG: EamA-like transporter family protein [bacterium ADurb.Bin212]|nr:MAG: EamA-like transporter family protein [bacterium ADurb.Bin212]
MLNAIIASIGYAGGIVTDKILLSKRKIPLFRFVPMLFVFLAIFTAILLAKWGSVNLDLLLTPKYLFLVIIMVATAVTWNILYYRGIQQEDIHEFELIMLLSPMVTIILAEIFLPQERNWQTFLAGVVASLALLLTRFRHHHVQIGKIAWMTMLAMFLMSIESIFIKMLLDVLSPVSLYFLRTTILAIVFVFAYRPKMLGFSKSSFFLLLLTAMLGVVQMVLKFYGFDKLGVTETTMILVLGPFLVYFLSFFWFREKLFKRDVFAFIVLISCILFVTFK